MQSTLKLNNCNLSGPIYKENYRTAISHLLFSMPVEFRGALSLLHHRPHLKTHDRCGDKSAFNMLWIVKKSLGDLAAIVYKNAERTHCSGSR